MAAHRLRPQRRRRLPLRSTSLAAAAAVAVTMTGPAPAALARARDPRTISVARALHGAARDGGSDRVFGLSSPGADGGLNSAISTTTALGRSLGVLNSYQAWSFFGPLPVDWLTAVAQRGALPEITWEPWDPARHAEQPEYAPARIASGAFDDYLDWWARSAATYGKPVLMRYAHEMNGTTYPWAPAVNNGSPEAFVAAWRHVHDRFVAAGATNVIWVWSPNVTMGLPTPLKSVWPGRDYVDVVAVDGYNYGSDHPEWGGWNRPKGLFASTIRQVERLAPDKPLWVNETGSTEHGGDKARWITELLAYLRTTRTSGLVWFDFDLPGEPDFRLASSPQSFAAAADALRDW